MDIKKEIKLILHENLGLSNVDDEADFFKDLKFDVNAFYEIRFSIEYKFDIIFSKEESKLLNSVENCAKLVRQKLKK